MEIKDKIFKRKSGKSKDKWIIRIEYFDEILGKSRSVERQVEKKSGATDERDRLVEDIKKTQGQIQTGERMTFAQLVDVCERAFYKPAVIVEGRKIAGVRSYESLRFQINNLRSFFGKRMINEITAESLTDYKVWRLTTKSEKLNRPVKIATANRELSAMRKIMHFAYGKGWVLRDIFFNAKVIDTAGEVERHRLLHKDEEVRLLDSCQGEREISYTRTIKGIDKKVSAKISVDNPHLKAMIILALDSGMRRGEIFKLRWKDIDSVKNLIRVVGTHTKTERERMVPLSERAKEELEKIKTISTGECPFPFTNIKRSFATAKRLAGIEDLHFHDLRRTAITRWMQRGTPLSFAGKFAGHSQLQTTMKHYVAIDTDMIQELNEKMNRYHTENENTGANSLIN